MLYKALGFAVWKGAKWYLGRKLPPARLLAGAGARLQAARHEVAVLQARLGETLAQRDRMAAIAAGRRDELDAARAREAALRERVRIADGDVARVRDPLPPRAAAQA